MNNAKFFNQKLPKRCEYCVHSKAISGGKEFFCMNKGITLPQDNCRKYEYNPLKRKPVTKDIGRDFKTEDLKL